MMDVNVCANLEDSFASEFKEKVEKKIEDIYIKNILDFYPNLSEEEARKEALKGFSSYLNVNIDKLSMIDFLKEVYKHQYNLQKKVYEIYPEVNLNPEKDLDLNADILNVYNLQVWVSQNLEYFQDEWRELMNALGGKKYGSAVWKKHKAKHREVKDLYPNEVLDKDDKLEIFYEFIDIIHFVMNFLIPIEVNIGKEGLEEIFNFVKEYYNRNERWIEEESKEYITFSQLDMSLRNIYYRYLKLALTPFYEIANGEFETPKNPIFKKWEILKQYYSAAEWILAITIVKLFPLLIRALSPINGRRLRFSDIYRYYMFKNAENIRRWENQY